MQAKGFYAVIVAATLLGTVICFSPLDPIRTLFWSAVTNGVVAVPVMVMMMIMTSNEDVMGKFMVRGPLRIIGWIATLAMAAAATGMGIAAIL
jgi:Mn2+/Fe2+ NRAMP family transporter